MAESIALYLKINGADVQGESSIEKSAGVDRGKSIEVLGFQVEAMTPRDVATGRSSVSSRQLLPITITKKIDKSSPLVLQALCQNQTVEGEFKFFRANPDTGSLEHFFTVKFEHGRVTQVKEVVHDIFDQKYMNYAPVETWSFSYGKITWTSVTGKTEFTDEWSNRV